VDENRRGEGLPIEYGVLVYTGVIHRTGVGRCNPSPA